MALAFVQRTTVAVSSVASNTVAMTTTAGNFLFITAADGSNFNGPPSTGISDNRGDTFTLVQYLFASVSVAQFYSMNIAGGATTFTCLMNQANGSNAAYVIEEWSGVATSNALDVSAGGTPASTTTPTSATTATTTQANEVVFVSAGIAGATTTVTAGAGYSNVGTLVGVGTAGAFANTESKVVAATGTQVGTFTLGAARLTQCMIATFKEAVAGATGPSTPVTSQIPGNNVMRSFTW